PKATFAGEIVEQVDLTKTGSHQVEAKGKLTIHGVTKERSIPVNIDVVGGKIKFNSNLKVKLVDHDIEVPSIVVTNIAEVIDVKVSGVLKPKE
ncbi:MAG: YceI family protein, partial [Bacteroidota bacterium]|nr:YceI family protein [Bacteroidota bacterium]MDX5429640.1 YceI family protein [Bacteroidota bacterium]MDX5468421.1 YceI family protein [Bacteroidota bacterium]